MRTEPVAGAGNDVSAPFAEGRVAVVHDWLTGMRGGEKVLESILNLYPRADIFTLVHVPGKISERVNRHTIRTSFIGRLPWASRRHQIYLPLFPCAVGAFDLSGYDLVLSTSHCVAKGAVVRPGTPHVCYCHTPMRYAWDFKELYFGGIRPAPLKWLVDFFLEGLRLWDVVSSSRVDRFIANSNTVARRIARYYGRPSTVIPPPVDTGLFTPVESPSKSHFVVLSAFVPYKRLDLAIEAANRLRAPLKVVGDGVESRRLARLAGPTVEFLGALPPKDLRDILAHCRALIFPGEEDFGITPVETNACGRPVVAYRAGGATESMVDGETAVFFDRQEVEPLVDAMRQVERMSFDPARLRANAARFSVPRFETEMARFLTAAVAELS